MPAARLTALLAGCAALLAPATSAPASLSPRPVSAWLAYWDTRGLETFVRNADLFDELMPFWYEMRSATTIASYPGAGDPRVVDAAREAKVRLVPTITNDFDPERVAAMLSTDATIDAHVERLALLSQPYDGLDVDYESVRAADRDLLTRFYRRLASRLHVDGKWLSITVHPKTSEPGSWDGPQSQDWAQIGAVADRVRIMAYDFHWATSEAGPIAPASWVDQVARFAASQIPPGKVDLGIPLYGYDWAGNRGTGIMWDEAERRRSEAGATLVRATDGAEPSFTYAADSGQRTVWYSDGESTSPKLESVDRHGLHGIAFWRLGGEDPDVWTRVRAWTEQEAPDTTPPARVSNLTAKAGFRSVTLRWVPPADPGALRFQLWRATKATGPLTKIAVTSTAWYRNEDLRSGRRFWYAVRPLDPAGNAGPMSGRVTAVAG